MPQCLRGVFIMISWLCLVPPHFMTWAQPLSPFFLVVRMSTTLIGFSLASFVFLNRPVPVMNSAYHTKLVASSIALSCAVASLIFLAESCCVQTATALEKLSVCDSLDRDTAGPILGTVQDLRHKGILLLAAQSMLDHWYCLLGAAYLGTISARRWQKIKIGPMTE